MKWVLRPCAIMRFLPGSAAFAARALGLSGPRCGPLPPPKEPPAGRTKQSRQNTGRPGVGAKGTVASLPHLVQVIVVLDPVPGLVKPALISAPGCRAA